MYVKLGSFPHFLFYFIEAFSEKECELWIRGLENLIQDTVSSPFPLQVERWLRKEFYSMEPVREVYVVIFCTHLV